MTDILRVVDPHFHLWDLSTGNYPGFEKPSTGFIGSNAPIARSYLMDEYLAEGGTEVEVVKAVFVEAIPVDALKEARYVQVVAEGAPIPIGLVAAADLSAPDADARLEALSSCASLRGIRQILNRHIDPLYNYVARDFMDEPAWRQGFGLLARHGLSFDLQLYPTQMAQAAELAAEHGDTQIILNHAGMWTDRSLAGWRLWRDGLRQLAGEPNVSVKISGLGMLDINWTIESIRPLVLETIDAFGTDRVMFASNFPVDKLFSDFATIWRAFDAIVADLSADEREKLFRTNAERVYRI
jgi:predicted TIM-barrel fold metal-dependent hydrolase